MNERRLNVTNNDHWTLEAHCKTLALMTLRVYTQMAERVKDVTRGDV